MSQTEIFNAAVKLSPDERAAFLDRACGANPELRSEVESLLHAHDALDSFLREPVDRTGAYEPLAERAGSVIGPYKLLEQIGEGGFGVVFMAEQIQPVRRKVALKVLKPGMDTKQVVARFEAERQALAIMDHPNIARVFDGGATPSGRLYFVMELVKGVSITEFCDQNHLTPRQRLELFISVCQAVQHAHQKGIIHRDLKPSNILVTVHDTKPVVKVIDFGVAKALGQELTDKTLFTGFAQMIGTPLYMSPEQAGQSGLDIDTRSDIYSLGVLLYELLTGTTPFSKERFQKATYDEIRRIIREEEPSKPSTKLSTADGLPTLAANRGTEPAKLTKLVRGELDWIVMKALEKDRNRRYETANGFAADVRRYLADEPVQACPPSAGYRLKKFARRNKAGLATAGLILLFVVLLGGVVGWGMRDRAAREREIALEAGRELARTEEGIRQALDRGTSRHTELHALLLKPGGVQQLLNQPARWELFIKTGQGELTQVRQLAGRAEGSLYPKWAQAMDQVEQQLTSDQADYYLALRLEKIRLEASTLVEGRFAPAAHAEREYPRAFAEAGLAVEPGREQEVATQIGQSAIKHQLLAALDDWAVTADELRQDEVCRRLLAVARLADPDPWRDRVRDPALWGKRAAVVPLAEQAQNDPERFGRLTPQMLVLVGRVIADEKAAEAWLRKAQALHPADFWINFLLAQKVHRGKGREQEAIGFLRAALAVRPRSAAVYNQLGIGLSNQMDLAGALEAFETAVTIEPECVGAWTNLGIVRAKRKDLPGAIDAHKKALAIDKEFALAWTNLGLALAKRKDLPGAIEAYKKGLAIDAKDATAWTALGLALYLSKDLPGAIDAHKKALGIDEKLVEAWTNLGLALKASKDLPGAIDAHKKALAIDRQSVMAWNNLGLALRASKDLPGAIDAYKKALAIDPKDAAVWTNLGATLYLSKDLPGALDACKKAVAIVPEDAAAWNNLGAALKASNDFPGAIDAFKKALAIDDQNAATWHNLGIALGASKDLPGAIDAYKKAIAIDSQFDAANNSLAWLLATCPDATLRDSEQAVALAEKAVKFAPENPNYPSTLGAAYYRAGDSKAAIVALKKSLELRKGGDSFEWFFLAMAYWKLGEKDKAHEWYDRAVQWMDKNQPTNEELRRFRTEASELMELKEKK